MIEQTFYSRYSRSHLTSFRLKYNINPPSRLCYATESQEGLYVLKLNSDLFIHGLFKALCACKTIHAVLMEFMILTYGTFLKQFLFLAIHTLVNETSLALLYSSCVGKSWITKL